LIPGVVRRPAASGSYGSRLRGTLEHRVEYQITFEVDPVVLVIPGGNRRIAHRGEFSSRVAETGADLGLGHAPRRSLKHLFFGGLLPNGYADHLGEGGGRGNGRDQCDYGEDFHLGVRRRRSSHELRPIIEARGRESIFRRHTSAAMRLAAGARRSRILR